MVKRDWPFRSPIPAKKLTHAARSCCCASREEATRCYIAASNFPMEIYRETKMRPPEKSRAVKWIVIILSVPLVYLLSVPPLVLATLTSPANPKEGEANDSLQSPWLMRFYASPYDWVASKT